VIDIKPRSATQNREPREQSMVIRRRIPSKGRRNSNKPSAARVLHGIVKPSKVNDEQEFLTVNSSAFFRKFHQRVGNGCLSDPVLLAQLGFHRAAKFIPLLKNSASIPKNVPGSTLEAKRTNYAEYLAAEVRLSCLIAAIAHPDKNVELSLSVAAPGASVRVKASCSANTSELKISILPASIRQIDSDAVREVLPHIKGLQRIYQLTPDDDAMLGLMKLTESGTNGGYSALPAYLVARFLQELFDRIAEVSSDTKHKRKKKNRRLTSNRSV